MSNKINTYLFYICSVILLVSAIGFFFEKSIMPYLYAVSGAGVAVSYLANIYKGDNLRLKRLNIQQIIAALLLPISSYLMFKGINEWFVFLFLSAFLQVYVVYARDHELKKANGKNSKPSK